MWGKYVENSDQMQFFRYMLFRDIILYVYH